MQRSTIAKRAWVLLLAALAFTYLYGLGAAPLVGADEPRYAQVAREMYERGDLVTPTLGGLRWFEKPVLLYWLMCAGYALFGVTELAARLGPALAGLLSIFLVWWMADRAEGSAPTELRGLGTVCAAVLAASAGLLVFSRGASFDILLTAAVTFSLACLFVSELEMEGPRRTRLLAGFYAGVGLALLAKGLVGVILPCGVAALYFALIRRRGPLRLGLVWGVPLALAVAALWYGPVIARHGYEFIDEFFVKHHFSRYVSNRYRHPQPFYFYLPVVALLALPWTVFLGAALVRVRDWRVRSRGAWERLGVFALAWALVPVVFFSFSVSKLPGYVLPALPGAALLAGHRLLLYLRGEGGTGLMRATGLLALGLAGAGLFYELRFEPLPLGRAVAVLLPSAVVGLVCLLFAARRRELCAWSLVAGSFLTVCLTAALAFGDFARRESVRDLLSAADARGLGGVPVVKLHRVERTAEFYAAGRIAYAGDGQPQKADGPVEVLEEARRRGGRALVFVPVEVRWQLDDLPGARTEFIGENGVLALFYVVTD